MQAIITKYLGPTNFRGSRVKASAQAGSITLSWDHSLNSNENHLQAAKALMNKFSWHKHSIISGHGELPGGKGIAITLKYYRDKD